MEEVHSSNRENKRKKKTQKVVQIITGQGVSNAVKVNENRNEHPLHQACWCCNSFGGEVASA
jgi:hypothetical protein